MVTHGQPVHHHTIERRKVGVRHHLLTQNAAGRVAERTTLRGCCPAQGENEFRGPRWRAWGFHGDG